VSDPTIGSTDQAWLTPGVRGIGSASLLADIGHEIPTALLPSLLTSTLAAPASALGLIEGVSDGLAGVARLGGGALADDPSRRRAVAVGGYTTTAVLAAGTGAATAVWQVGLLRAGAWTARGLRVPARNALLADVVPPAAYGRAYGFERAMDNLGAIIGPLAALGLVATIGTRAAIAVSAVPGLLATVAIVYAIRHTTTPTSRERTPIQLKVRPLLAVAGTRRLFAGIGLFEIANIAATLMILRATELLEPEHGHDTAAQIALALYVGYNATATITSLAAGHISDRRTPRLVLAVGAGAFAVAYLGLATDTTTWITLAPWFIAAGVGTGAVETAQHAAVATTAPDHIRGSAFGLLAGTQSLGNLIASTTTGILWTTAGPGWAFAIIGVVMIAAAAALGSTPSGTVSRIRPPR
jgi:MFS family permease